MMSNALRALRWSLSLGGKIGRVVPWWTILIVIVALISQISMLLASFLPLKVVILLGSEGMPRYIPSELACVGKDPLIVWFSLLTVGLFIVHLLAEKLMNRVTERATGALMQRSHKLVLFERQDEVAAGAYQCFSRALAGGVFVGLALLGIALFYTEMAMVIAGYLLFSVLVLWCLTWLSDNVRERLEEQPGPILTLMAGVGFFVAFGYLVLDFIVFSPPGVIPAIVALLLSRMIMQKAGATVMDVYSLNRQRTKLDALFFHGKVFLPQSNDAGRGVWALIQPEERASWVNALGQEFIDGWQKAVDIDWFQSGLPNVMDLMVQETSGRRYLVKLFDHGRQSFAIHEATLTGECIELLPAPEFITSTQLRQFQCLIYLLPEGRRPGLIETKQCVEPVNRDLMAVEPPDSLVKQYSRSRPMLWQRLDSRLMERVLVCAGSEYQRELARKLSSRLVELQDHLRHMPLVLVNPDINASSLYLTENEPLLLNWGRWSIDPVGSGWRDREKPFSQLASYFEAAAVKRPTLKKVSAESAELAALAFAFEAKCSRQLFSDAFELLPGMLERMDQVRHATVHAGDLGAAL